MEMAISIPRKKLDGYLKTTTIFREPRVDDFSYIDLNKDGVVNDKDQAPIGYSNIPRVIYGLSLRTFEYKGFDLTTLFRGVGKYTSNYTPGRMQYIIRGTISITTKRPGHLNAMLHGEKISYPGAQYRSNTNHMPTTFSS